MKARIAAIVLDAADLEVESAFWAGLLDGEVERLERHHVIRAAGQPILGIQHAPSHVPPRWPDGEPQQIHLDLVVDDIRSAHEEVMAAGATYLSRESEPDAQSGFWVYADPAGHPFCLCW